MLLEERYRDNLTAYWSSNAPTRYRDLEIGMAYWLPPELFHIPRKSLGRLLVARSGHGDFAAYHRCFNHTEAELYCFCGQEKSLELTFSCQLTRKNNGGRRNFRGRNTRENIKWILSTKSGAKAFHQRFCRS
ncbi:hypothetical protein EV44_g4033 [Erysiphe necator]|uniref:Uncharacterized protein n=1 Tax=Uncinula necator TaxID=52586 RepID=A0A0B1P003_UNCNE|nr:hypothetical protein EV44_g4033 [Erysiphe necator]